MHQVKHRNYKQMTKLKDNKEHQNKQQIKTKINRKHNKKEYKNSQKYYKSIINNT